MGKGQLPRGKRVASVTRAKGGVRGLLAAGLAAGAVCMIAPVGTAPAAAQDTCVKSDFEAVVDDAAGVLRDLNQQNKPAFQEKLRKLKDKRGWSHEAFLTEAEPYVRDDQIAIYDKQSEEMLAKISSMGQEGADAKTPDCKVLAQLKGFMTSLVEQQTKKWAYMSEKLDKALAK